MAVNPLILICLLTVLAATVVSADSAFGSPSNYSSHTFELNTTHSNEFELYDLSEHEVKAQAGDDKWALAVQRGAKLLQGMRADDKAAAALYGLGKTAESPYDGELHEALEAWGYADNTEAMQKENDRDCDMEEVNSLKTCFDDLGLGTKSKGQGGPNECFMVDHFNGPAVIKNDDGSMPPKNDQKYKAQCGTIMRITNAFSEVGINAVGGMVIALNIQSPASAAKELWGRDPLTEELPHIRSFSDIFWAFWNRAAAGNIQNIRYFMAAMVINKETNRHIRRILEELNQEQTRRWPGNEFSMDTEAGKALLGAPVGRWAGYFLMQHKRQLGGNKFISKVRMFQADMLVSLPYLLFYVDGPGVTSNAEDAALSSDAGRPSVSSRVLRRSKDGLSVVREHVFRV